MLMPFFLYSLKQFAEQRPALDLMTADELTGIADSLKEAKRAAAAAAAALPAANGDVAMETEEAVANGESAAAAAKGPQEVGAEAAAATAEVDVDEPEIKAHWLSGVEALYNVSSRRCHLIVANRFQGRCSIGSSFRMLKVQQTR